MKKWQVFSSRARDKKHGIQYDDGMGNILMTEKHVQDVYYYSIHVDHIYDIDSESVMEENMNWHSQHPINIESHFMELEVDILDYVLYDYDFEVCDEYFIFDKHCVSSPTQDIYSSVERIFHDIKCAKHFQPLTYSTYAFYMHTKQQI